MTDFDAIPIVDISARRSGGGSRRTLAEQLREICHEVGFFVITDHGVDPSVVDDVFELMERFFALPDDDKALIDKARSPHFRGWEAVGSEYTNNRVDVREQIDAWSEWPSAVRGDDSTVDPPYLRLHGPNQWMRESVLPGHRRITERWMRELGVLADDLLGLLALGLGLAETTFTEMFGPQPMSLTKLIHYPPTPDGGAGVNAHHDTGFLTLLAPGPVAGLQVQNHAGDWVDVPSVPGAFVVNLGEMLQAMTGNYLVATPHRVIAATDRCSAGYFHGPSLDVRLDRLDLDPSFAAQVAASPHHSTAGFMASAAETVAGTADMASRDHATTYGDQLWRYFCRSYPDNVRRHHPDVWPDVALDVTPDVTPDVTLDVTPDVGFVDA